MRMYLLQRELYKYIQTLQRSLEFIAKMLNQVLIVVGLLFTFAFGLPLIEERIYGGSEAKLGQFPHQVSLRINRSGKYLHTCGGSIISNRYIVTAAHCYSTSYPNVSDYRVVVGAHKYNGDDGRLYGVKRFTVHEKWDSNVIINDIALVEVNEVIAFNERVAAISLHRTFFGGEVPAITSGWGSSNVTLQSFLNNFSLHSFLAFDFIGFNYQSEICPCVHNEQ